MKKLNIFFLCFLIIFAFSCEKVKNPHGPDLDPINPPQSPAALTAACSADVLEGEVPLVVTFTGAASGGVEPYIYAWDFGDGETSDLQNPSHTYLNSGDYAAVFTVTDNGSNVASDSINIQVSPPLFPCLVQIHARIISIAASSAYWVFEVYLDGEDVDVYDDLRTYDGTVEIDGTLYHYGDSIFKLELSEGQHTVRVEYVGCFCNSFTGLPFKYELSATADDARAEIVPEYQSNNWFYISNLNDYWELTFTITEK